MYSISVNLLICFCTYITNITFVCFSVWTSPITTISLSVHNILQNLLLHIIFVFFLLCVTLVDYSAAVIANFKLLIKSVVCSLCPLYCSRVVCYLYCTLLLVWVGSIIYDENLRKYVNKTISTYWYLSFYSRSDIFCKMDKLTVISGTLFMAADVFAIVSLAMPDWIITDVGGTNILKYNLKTKLL